ncbi:MAG: hypothetical protein ACREAK_06490 [Nitrosarchaeum sp.]
MELIKFGIFRRRAELIMHTVCRRVNESSEYFGTYKGHRYGLTETEKNTVVTIESGGSLDVNFAFKFLMVHLTARSW